MRPGGDLNFACPRKLTQLDHGNARAWITAKIDKRLVCFQRPRDHFFSRLRVVREPNRRGCAGGCLLPRFFCKDCCLVASLG